MKKIVDSYKDLQKTEETKMKDLTIKDLINSREYENTQPQQFGNLHARMQFLMSRAKAHYKEIPLDLWNAIFDLETEVKYHKPMKPPAGKRTGYASPRYK